MVENQVRYRKRIQEHQKTLGMAPSTDLDNGVMAYMFEVPEKKSIRPPKSSSRKVKDNKDL